MEIIIRLNIHDSINVLSLGVEKHSSQSVPSAKSVLYITTVSSNPTITTPINGEFLLHVILMNSSLNFCFPVITEL